MQDTDYSKQIYLYDDRNKYDYMLKVTDILFEDDTVILCKTIMMGVPEYDGQEEEEKILINKTNDQVNSSQYDSWMATSDKKWIKQKMKEMIEISQ